MPKIIAVTITPAHAGKSLSDNSEEKKDVDHPRTCGEKKSVKASIPPFAGSPPHMRGKELLCDFADFYGGITPAHAGKRAGYGQYPA